MRAPKPLPTHACTHAEYAKIKPLLNVRLLDYKVNSGKEYLDAVRQDCLEVQR